jgi:beta-1,4-mannosyltransferase
MEKGFVMLMTSGARQKPITVLQSVTAPGPTIKFIDQVVRYAPDDVGFTFFGWREALFGSYDVLHVHWPEYFTRGSSRPVTAAKRILFRLLLSRLRRRRTPVVRTVHNLQPHSRGDSAENGLLARLDALTTVDVHLNECTPDRGIRAVVISHGDYREQLDGFQRSAPNPGRILFIGRIEPYKGVLELIEVVGSMPVDRVELRVVGRPAAEMRERIVRATSGPGGIHRNVSCRLDFVSDAAMVEEITSSQVVVLPYREMHNSGVLLVALSLGRPVLVPATCVNDAIAREVGDGWVMRYEGPLTPDQIEQALRSSRALDGLPMLDGRDWRTVAEAYAEVYRAAVVSAG